jgi:hypothetical protein
MRHCPASPSLVLFAVMAVGQKFAIYYQILAHAISMTKSLLTSPSYALFAARVTVR